MSNEGFEEIIDCVHKIEREVAEISVALASLQQAVAAQDEAIAAVRDHVERVDNAAGEHIVDLQEAVEELKSVMA
ncbi:MULTISPECIES: hypothetical protein [Gammaproteobacteria]|uniref:hypothetical protein n=1 Tax=Gammaproteobacteria TaxID=1236 RepID=UPI00112DF44C|nr:hypothetical protein [Pseudomonas sp. Hp2]